MDYLLQAEGELIAAAGRGDREAMAELVFVCLLPTYRGVIPDIETMAGAEAVALMLARSGGLGDELLLAEVLMRKARAVAVLDRVRAAAIRNQAYDIFNRVIATGNIEDREALAGNLTGHADAGDEAAAELLNKLTDGLTIAEAETFAANVKRERKASAALHASLVDRFG